MAQAARKHVETEVEVFKPEAPWALHRWLERLDIRAAAAARICCHQVSVGQKTKFGPHVATLDRRSGYRNVVL